MPSEEKITIDNQTKTVYHYFDENDRRVFKTKEIYKKKKLITFYPSSFNRRLGQITSKKIKTLQFAGWNNINELPKDFKITYSYGFKSDRIKKIMSLIYSKFKSVDKIMIGINTHNRFTNKSITFNWQNLETALKQINREKHNYDSHRKILITNILSDWTNKIKKVNRSMNAGDLDNFLNQYDTFEKINTNDVDSLTRVLGDIPNGKISTTSHIIKTKDKINIIYLDNILLRFEDLLKSSKEKEEKWQIFLEEISWILYHLFPFEVILRKSKAYVGGKTLENKDGKIVDYLFQNGFKDNYALLEIKTPQKELLKKAAYREPAVFSISEELSGGVNQCLDQKDSFLREMGQHYQSLDPKTILIIGQKNKLSKEQSKCFELYRANQKDVDIVTFDELYSKLKGLHEVITGNQT